MGLDITAYSKLAYIEPQPQTEEAISAAHDEHIYLYNANGYDRLLQPEGFYERLPESESTGVDCGAYSRYNRWRDDLARLAGWPLGEYNKYGRQTPSHAATAWEAEGGPFWELINFGDNEGCFGPAASQKLAADFSAYRASIEQRALLMNDDGYFMRKYDAWANAFSFAANGGALEFH